MTSILAIETSTPACSVALIVGDAKFSRYSEEPRSHTRLIMGMIDEVLTEAGTTVDQLDAIAVTVGPGSFTGLRIGFSTVQGLAFCANIPVIPVSTLKVLAQTYKRKQSECMDLPCKVMAVLDARMGEFNCGAYELNASGQFIAGIKDQLLSKSDALALYQDLNPSIIVGEAGALFDFSDMDSSDRCDIESQTLVDIYPDALDLLDIALEDFTQGGAVSIDQVDLVYLRGTDAWKKHTPIRPN